MFMLLAANLHTGRFVCVVAYIRIVVEDSMNRRESSCDISLTGLTPSDFCACPDYVFTHKKHYTLPWGAHGCTIRHKGVLHCALMYDPS